MSRIEDADRDAERAAARTELRKREGQQRATQRAERRAFAKLVAREPSGAEARSPESTAGGDPACRAPHLQTNQDALERRTGSADSESGGERSGQAPTVI